MLQWLGILQSVSPQEENVQIAVAGQSSNINIPCNLGRGEEAPFWFINGTTYELFSIPLVLTFIPVVNSYTELTIPTVTIELDDTLFQCATYNDEGLVPGIATRLRVQPSE